MTKKLEFESQKAEEIINLYNQGYGLLYLSKKFNCGITGLNSFLRRNNVKLKLKGKPKGSVSPIKGKTYEEYYGSEKAKEIKNKLSDFNKLNLKRENNPFYGKHHLEETKDKLRIKAINRWQNQEFFNKMCSIRKELFKSGKIIAHCKGKNRYNYEPLRRTGDASKGIPKTYEQRKKSSATKQGISLDKWERFTGFDPYTPEFNKEFKNLVKLRDNFCCLNCGISEQKHIILKGKKLTVHHIDYNKENTCLINCCTLCNSCNIKVNAHRIEWKNLFQSKLTEKYGYQYPSIQYNAKEVFSFAE